MIRVSFGTVISEGASPQLQFDCGCCCPHPSSHTVCCVHVFVNLTAHLLLSSPFMFQKKKEKNQKKQKKEKNRKKAFVVRRSLVPRGSSFSLLFCAQDHVKLLGGVYDHLKHLLAALASAVLGPAAPLQRRCFGEARVVPVRRP